MSNVLFYHYLEFCQMSDLFVWVYTFCFLQCTKCFTVFNVFKKLFLELNVILSFSERLTHSFQETLAALSYLYSRFVFRF